MFSSFRLPLDILNFLVIVSEYYLFIYGMLYLYLHLSTYYSKLFLSNSIFFAFQSQLLSFHSSLHMGHIPLSFFVITPLNFQIPFLNRAVPLSLCATQPVHQLSYD